MEEDLYAKPKRNLGRRNIAVVDDTVFQASLAAAVPSNEKVNIEPWNLPDFKKPSRVDELKSKNQMLNDLRLDFAKESLDPKQVLVTDAMGNPVQTAPIENEVPEFQSLVKPKTFDDYMKRRK